MHEATAIQACQIIAPAADYLHDRVCRPCMRSPCTATTRLVEETCIPLCPLTLLDPVTTHSLLPPSARVGKLCASSHHSFRLTFTHFPLQPDHVERDMILSHLDFIQNITARGSCCHSAVLRWPLCRAACSLRGCVCKQPHVIQLFNDLRPQQFPFIASIFLHSSSEISLY